MSINRQGVELFTAPQLRIMDEEDCIVLLKSTYAYKGKKYRTIDHPEYQLLSSLKPYSFNPEKIEYLQMNDDLRKEEFVITPEDNHGEIQDVSEKEQIIRQEREEEKEQKSAEMAANKDAEGKQIIQAAKDVDDNLDEVAEKLTSPNVIAHGDGYDSEKDQDYQAFLKENIGVWGEEVLQFTSTGADNADADLGFI